MRSRNCTQIWGTLRSAISVAFEILVKKLQVKDTEAYQEMMRKKFETFWGISTAILVLLPFTISVWARFWQNCWPNNYHSLSSSRSIAKTIMSNLDMSKLHDIWWNAMIEHDSSCSNALDSWNYRQLSWPLNGASVFLLRPWWKAIIMHTGSG